MRISNKSSGPVALEEARTLLVRRESERTREFRELKSPEDRRVVRRRIRFV